MIFLGVDGGGTKTALAVISGAGQVLARARVQGSYRAGAPGEGPRHVVEVLRRAVPEVCERAGATPEQLDFAFFGLPAYGELSADQPLLDEAPAKILGHDRYRCDNDVVCSWAGSLGLADGISVVAGTGSIAYGRWGDAAMRSGGWGELFGDEGSGYWIGIRALQAFSRMADGRLPAGPLHGLLRQHLRLEHDLDLLDVVLHRWATDRSKIAALSAVVSEAADAGDPTAAAILAQSAEELTQLVTAIVAGLQVPAGAIAVSYSGGVFDAPSVRETFADKLADLSGDIQVTPPLYEPVIGAALFAAQLAGMPLNAAGRARLRSEQLSTAVTDGDPD